MPLVENSESENRCSFRLRRIGTPATYPGISDTFKINKEVVVVGRNPSSSDIFLDSSKNKALISRLHARIIRERNDSENQSFTIADTSLNGTYVNDVKIADTCDLSPGDTVTFGHLKGAVLDSGMVAQQPNSEFRFKFESYPSTPPDKKQNKSKDISSTELQTKSQTPSPRAPKPAPKTPLFPAAHLPDLSAFLTPGTPSQMDSSTPPDKSRIPGTLQVRQSWHQHFINDSSSSDDSDGELMAYAAAAGEAMEDSDSEIFSVRLPDDGSPASLAESASQEYLPLPRGEERSAELAGKATSSNQVTNKRETFNNSTDKKSQAVGDDQKHPKPQKASKKRARKSATPFKKAQSKRAKNNEEEIEDYMFNSCSSVDCLHPHDVDKVVDWVQCDDCDEWYHVKCTGLSLKSVKQKSAKFHCGCV